MRADGPAWPIRVAFLGRMDPIGRRGSRAALCTPALVLDLAAFERNLPAAGVAAYCDRHGVALRPHAKTHKSVEVARRQLGAGAIGNAVATIGEAERLTGGGIGNLLITSACHAREACAPARVARARRRADEVADSAVRGVDALAETAAGAERRLIVLVDSG